MLVSKNETNLIDKSVKTITEVVPNLVNGIASLFVKYGRLIDQKYVDLTQSDEKRRIKGVNDLNSLFHLTFDKILFALDKDAYIDFLNEVKTLENEIQSNFCMGFFDKEVDSEYKGLILDNIRFKYLVNPSDGIKKLQSYEAFDNGVPLIKIEPRFELRDSRRSDNEKYNNGDIHYRADSGTELKAFYCNAFIDLSDILDIFTNVVKRYYDYNRTETPFSFLRISSESAINSFLEKTTKTLSNRIVYSMSTTYLATISKLISVGINPIFETFGDIMNSCRRIMVDNFDSQGDNAKSGLALRHMAIDISTLLNALSYAKESGNYSGDQYFILVEMIEYLAQVKYETYNYVKVPGNNLKHKNLIPIANLAKPCTSYLSGDTKADLQLAYAGVCYEEQEFKEKYIFVPNSNAQTNGTFALNKRIYDAGKDFVDTFARFIIIKKRMSDAGGLNFADGSIDTIGKRYVDYKSYLKLTYSEIKTSLVNIFNRIKSVTVGKRYLNSGNFMDKGNDEVIRNANTIIYGINTESVLTDSYIFKDIYRASHDYNSPLSFSKNPNSRYDLSYNSIINDIRLIYNVLKERNCTYAENSQYISTALNTYGSGSLVSLWIAITESVGSFFDSPFENTKTIIGEITSSYTTDSINEMAPANENVRKDLNKFEFKDWNMPEKGYISLDKLKMSFEDLKQKMEDAEEKEGESVVGGCLFGDFGGIPMAGDVTAKEAEYANAQNTASTVDPEYESFESFKHEFDEFLSNYL